MNPGNLTNVEARSASRELPAIDFPPESIQGSDSAGKSGSACSSNELCSPRLGISAFIAAEDERNSELARMLHDGVGQLLTAIRMRMEMFDGESELKDEIKNQINETISEVRRISYNVMPQSLVDFGLEAALDN